MFSAGSTLTSSSPNLNVGCRCQRAWASRLASRRVEAVSRVAAPLTTTRQPPLGPPGGRPPDANNADIGADERLSAKEQTVADAAGWWLGVRGNGEVDRRCHARDLDGASCASTAAASTVLHRRPATDGTLPAVLELAAAALLGLLAARTTLPRQCVTTSD